MNETNYLLLSLGHNSSAIFVADDGKIIGYEQERLSGIKADSQFPIDAINEIIKHVGLETVRNSKVCISHWFNVFDNIEPKPNKHFTATNKQFLIDLCGHDNIYYVNNKFTHHDAHAYSAYEFFNFYDKEETKDVYCAVVDGFGNNGEVVSLYKDKKLLHRVYGYNASLGLMYQYATSYVGMKENQDEYKFLGYESHIKEVLNEKELKSLDYFACSITAMLLNYFNDQTNKIETVIEQDLKDAKSKWYAIFEEALELYSSFIKEGFGSRCIIGYFIQKVCEDTLVTWLNQYNIENLIVAGGTFYNVKLNQTLLNKVAKNKFSVIPLAGDQGAAIGLYAKLSEKQFDFSNLYWGKRSFYNIDKYISQFANSFKNNIRHYCIRDCFEKADVIKTIADLVSNGNLVNIVMDNMEFGPRALGHTSTIFLPNKHNVDLNNRLNGRNEVMPCAPILTLENARDLFDDSIDKVVGSDRFMICTHYYEKQYSEFYGGIMHKHPLKYMYTGRPQVVHRNEFMHRVLTKVQSITDCKALVNTSFNVHGRPIVFNIEQILHNFEYQCERAVEINNGKLPFLIIIETL